VSASVAPKTGVIDHCVRKLPFCLAVYSGVT
jgi:hypothetical protein